MNNNLKDILSNSNKDIDNQKLMDYLSQQISETDSHNLEKEMLDDVFMNDAVEGLQNIEKKKNVQLYVAQLNNDLLKQVAKNKKHKLKRKLKEQPYSYYTIILILLLLIISFIVLRRNHLIKFKENKPATAQNCRGISSNNIFLSFH